MNVHRRKLLVVDLENLAGCSPREATTALYREAFAELSCAAGVTADDLVVIGVNPHLAFVARDIAPMARVVVGNGPDGADLRLLEELHDPLFIKRRFTEVVIASGDHRFLDAVVRLNYYDVTTTVASVVGQLANCLRLAAQQVVWLRRPRNIDEAAA